MVSKERFICEHRIYFVPRALIPMLTHMVLYVGDILKDLIKIEEETRKLFLEIL
jgi:hypothetical protein